MQNIPEGYRYKRSGIPTKGERIVLTNGDVVPCCGRIHAVCDIVELIEPEKIENMYPRKGERRATVN